MRNKRTTQFFVAAAGVFAAGAVQAGTTVAWINPADGSTYPCGTEITPSGQASSRGVVGGSGLDLALVIDTSGSMTAVQNGKTRIVWAKEAAQALVSALPPATTSVAIITFDDDAQVYRQLTSLIPAANVTSLNNALAALTAPGPATAIGSGIKAAAGELTGAGHTVGRSQQMIVLSDGFNNAGPSPLTEADLAVGGGVDSIHTVGVPGHDPDLMANIANGPNAANPADDYGVYTSVNDLATLKGLFDGTAGNLVGLDKVEVTMPDGTKVVVPTDGLGNFSAPAGWNLADGPQTWVATAYGKDGTSATASLTINGECTTGVPDATSSLPLLALGLLGVGRLAARRR